MGLSFHQAIERSGPIPADSAARAEKKTYSELLSRELAFEVSEILAPRHVFRSVSPRRGVDGPEKYFLGGFGKKKIDVSIADEQSGLLLAVSIKTITSRDTRTKNYNKNFKNRFGDLCAESTSVHMRSPYTVMSGLFAMPTAAAYDGTDRRTSTAHRAMRYLRSISGRTAHELSFERFESLTFMLFDPAGSESGQSNLSLCAFEGVENLPPHGRPFRLFDPYAGREVDVDGYAEELERQFLVRNPFVDD